MDRPVIKRINLALQGGGAHGAFTWGVLNVLLADEQVEIAAMSGTSAGALNGAAVKAGLVAGGREAALENLRWLWGQIGAVTEPEFAPWLAAFSPWSGLWAKAMDYSPAFTTFDMTTRMMSPYVYGNLLQNPLAKIVEDFHFSEVCSPDGPGLWICATNVRSGKIKLFTGDDIGPKAIMASACLPSLFKAVEIKDENTGKTEAYWDGGYTGNPALFPLFNSALPDDILVININPLYREELPTDSPAIQNRINEISFNSSLLRELRSISFVKRLLSDGSIRRGTMKDVLVHMIADDPLMNELNVATKTIPNALILNRLKDAGETAAKAFLATYRDDLNVRSTVDLAAMFS